MITDSTVHIGLGGGGGGLRDFKDRGRWHQNAESEEQNYSKKLVVEKGKGGKDFVDTFRPIYICNPEI